MSEITNGGLFKSKGFTLEQRKLMFYLICIFFRLFLAGIVYNFSNSKIVQYATLLLGSVAVYLNYSKLSNPSWWKSEYHLLIAILVVICSYLILTKKFNKSKYLAYLLYADVLFGLIDSLITKFKI